MRYVKKNSERRVVVEILSEGKDTLVIKNCDSAHKGEVTKLFFEENYEPESEPKDELKDEPKDEPESELKDEPESEPKEQEEQNKNKRGNK